MGGTRERKKDDQSRPVTQTTNVELFKEKDREITEEVMDE